jgi:hypothetical protein
MSKYAVLLLVSLIASGCALDDYGSGGSSGGSSGSSSADRNLTPEPGVRCDSVDRVCYDRSGPSVALTRSYFGDAAAERLGYGSGGSGTSGSQARMVYPESDVVCDRSTQICYDDGKASVSKTQSYFGDSAAKKLKQHSNDARPEPKWVFEPDADTSCDMRTQVCYGPKGPNVNKTRKYFGEAAGARLQQNLGGGTVVKEKKGVGCDQSVQICYDENGPSVKKTEKYFGAAAAAKLKKQMKR